MDLLPRWRVRDLYHFIHVGRAEILAGVAVLSHAALVANSGVSDDQVCRLVFFVFRPGEVDVGQLVEGQLAIAFGRIDDVRLGTPVARQLRQLLHALVACMIAVMGSHTTSPGDLLHSRVEHPG